MAFFDYDEMQAVIEDTDGVLVSWKGEEAHFHMERPTPAVMENFPFDVRGSAELLVGSAESFHDIAEDDIVTVDGETWLVAAFTRDEDGHLFIALTREDRG